MTIIPMQLTDRRELFSMPGRLSQASIQTMAIGDLSSKQPTTFTTDSNAMRMIASLLRYTMQCFALLLFSFIVFAVNIYYYTEHPLYMPRNYVFPTALAICTLEVLLITTKNWRLFYKLIAVLIVVFQVKQMMAFEEQLDRKKFLHKHYVIDFSYDKYCNLGGEDKLLLEEISIYGYTDCDDAKIPYKKLTIDPL
jgi:hypothetical protein